jgi:hypothetical protein
MRGDRVGQAAGVVDAGDRGQDLGRDLLVELDVLVELLGDGAAQGLDLFTVPSGSFSICRIDETQPTSNMSSGLGSSLPAAFWATSMIWRPASIATSSALIDFGRPTNSGMTMCGKTTTSRKGSNGSVIFSAGKTG